MPVSGYNGDKQYTLLLGHTGEFCLSISCFFQWPHFGFIHSQLDHMFRTGVEDWDPVSSNRAYRCCHFWNKWAPAQEHCLPARTAWTSHLLLTYAASRSWHRVCMLPTDPGTAGVPSFVGFDFGNYFWAAPLSSPNRITKGKSHRFPTALSYDIFYI